MTARPVLLLALLAACGSPSVGEPRSAPTALTVAISPESPTSAQDLVAVITEPSTVDGDAPVAYRYHWSADGQERPDLLGSTVPAAETVRGQRWSVAVTPIAADAPEGPTASAEVVVLNAPPVIEARLSPDEPTTLDDLVAHVEAWDPDDDAFELTTVWSVDGEPIDVVASRIPATMTRRGERYLLTITATDSEGARAELALDRTIGNSLPRAHSVEVGPDPAFVTDDLHAQAAVFDADDDPITLTWLWRVDGAEVLASPSPTLPAGSFRKHQQVTVEVIPDDGFQAGPGVRSQALRVHNTPPTAPGIRIGPGLASVDDPLVCEVVEPSFDADGDPLTYHFTWTVDGERFEGASDTALSSTIEPADLTMHQLWSCEVTADDGEVRGPPTVRRKQLGVPGKRLALGQEHTCAIRDDAALFCWGGNGWGQLGDGTFDRRLRPTPVAPGLEWADVSVSYYHTCAITVDGALYCWGDNQYGQLGDGTTTLRVSPVLIDAEKRWEHVSVGWYHSCARTIDGEAWCWGANWSGYLGDGTSRERWRPTRVIGGYRWVDIDVGAYHSCGLTDDDQALCWGDNGHGRLGDGTWDVRWAPGEVLYDGAWRSVRAADRHSCGVTIDDRVRCWGYNGYGELGDGTYLERMTPTAPSADPAFKLVLPGSYHTCALDLDDDLWCWGANWYGQFGDGTYDSTMVPRRTVRGFAWAQLAADHYHACGFTTDETLYCWGAGWNGQLGDGTTSSRTTPLRITLE